MDISLLLFEMYKDSIIYYKPFEKRIKKDYGLDTDTIKRLVNKMWDYQKNKYGETLTGEAVGFETREELLKRSIKERVRKNSLKRYRERR